MGFIDVDLAIGPADVVDSTKSGIIFEKLILFN
jgi:hypothetical protein